MNLLLRSNLDYADIIYDRPLNESFKRIIAVIQYNAALMIIVLSRGPPVIKYIKSLVWNLPQQIEDGLEKKNFFIK